VINPMICCLTVWSGIATSFRLALCKVDIRRRS
jgi:hypothetical protein